MALVTVVYYGRTDRDATNVINDWYLPDTAVNTGTFDDAGRPIYHIDFPTTKPSQNVIAPVVNTAPNVVVSANLVVQTPAPVNSVNVVVTSPVVIPTLTDVVKPNVVVVAQTAPVVNASALADFQANPDNFTIELVPVADSDTAVTQNYTPKANGKAS